MTAQPQNMTVSHRKSGEKRSSDIYHFSINNFNFTSLELFEIIFCKTYNFKDILSFPWILILNLAVSV